ncbi:MAG TPA: hypothetical protein VHK90_02885, partial [Thermoanaerobaculia bacterium]|nr:hypothetical protein [Thermoanaerobaculia bacterium]
MTTLLTLNRASARRALLAFAGTAIIAAAISIWKSSEALPHERLSAGIRSDGKRPTMLQLSHLPYVAAPDRRRDRHSQTVRAAQAVLAGRLGKTTDDAHAAAVARLLAGSIDAAVSSFARLTRAHPERADLWNDYAVGLCEQSKGTKTELLVLALVAVDRALQIDGSFLDARFNRAMLLDHLRLERAARRAWIEYVTADPASTRADDVRRILTRNRGRPSRTWPATRSQFVTAALQHDASTVDAILRSFAEEARIWAEGIYLSEWAADVLRGNDAGAKRALAIARFTGERLDATSGEGLLRQAVHAIDAA